MAQTYLLNGYIKDDKQSLVGAIVRIENMAGVGAQTDQNGYFEIKLEKGQYLLNVSYVGYETQKQKIDLTKNTTIEILLSPSDISLNDVVITTSRPDENVSSPQTGVSKLSMKELQLLPVLLGERDVIKAIQFIPGVKSAGEGSTGFYVRGGSADQNLVLLDDVGLYNASHLLGFFSTFNPEAVSGATLYKGTMPAQYGERLSSILDVQMRTGNKEKFGISGGIGLISSKLTLEGPIQKDKSSFLVSARRTYADALLKAMGASLMKEKSLYFYDLNAKFNFILSPKDELFFSGYWGKDKLGLDKIMNTDWGNLLGSLRWSHLFSNKLTSSTSVYFNRYAYNVDVQVNTDLMIQSVIQDYGFKQDFYFKPNPKNTWRFGFHSIYHDLSPGKYQYAEDKGVNQYMKHRYSWENGIFAGNTFEATDKLEMVYGLRLSSFSVLGKGDFYTLNDKHEVVDTISYSSDKFVKTYLNLEPRLSMAYKLNSTSSVKVAYARTTQNMHLLSIGGFSSPYDRWISSSNNIKPQISDQFSLGYFRNFEDNMFEFSAEVYYKNLKNQLDLKDNAEVVDKEDIDSEILTGKGRAYGIELQLKKTKGAFTGWISYTLSKSEKKINGINENRWYNAIQDRTHDISIVGMYQLNKKWNISATWVYYTGNAVTYPSGKYTIDETFVPYYSERNGYRAPAYHRLDLGATCVLKDTKKFYSELALGLYNAYGRQNAYLLDFRTNDDDPSKSSVYQYSLFSFVPSISWNFKF